MKVSHVWVFACAGRDPGDGMRTVGGLEVDRVGLLAIRVYCDVSEDCEWEHRVSSLDFGLAFLQKHLETEHPEDRAGAAITPAGGSGANLSSPEPESASS